MTNDTCADRRGQTLEPALSILQLDTEVVHEVPAVNSSVTHLGAFDLRVPDRFGHAVSWIQILPLGGVNRSGTKARHRSA